MKKTTAKLQLKKSTVRLLQDSALADVRGGNDDADVRRGGPTNDVILCSHSCHCPPIIKGGGPVGP
jgi:hypothetical protein